MLLWEYQDKGYKYYRLKTNGDNCKACMELENKVFSIKEAEIGENLAPLHPKAYETTVGTIHYSNKGTHIVPEKSIGWRK